MGQCAMMDNEQVDYYNTLTDCVNDGKYIPPDLRNSLGCTNRSIKCNSYANEFPIDGIQACKYDNGLMYPYFLTGAILKKGHFSHRNA